MKACVVSIIFGLVFFPICLASRAASESEVNERNAMITSNHLGQVSMAYRSVVAQMMLAEASYFSQKLNLPTPHPLRISDVEIHPFPPLFSIQGGNLWSLTNKLRPTRFVICGEVMTTNVSFVFNQGYLWVVENRLEYDEHARSLIDTNMAYRLATQWLAAVDFDVDSLNNKYKRKVEQRWYWPTSYRPTRETNLDSVLQAEAAFRSGYLSTAETNRIMLPTFVATWGTSFDMPASAKTFEKNLPPNQATPNLEGTWEGEAATARILGTKKELMELRLGDLSLSRRPQLVITNAIELSNTPDPPVNRLRREAPKGQTNLPSPPSSSRHSDN